MKQKYIYISGFFILLAVVFLYYHIKYSDDIEFNVHIPTRITQNRAGTAYDKRFVTIKVGEKTVFAELAKTPQELHTGLMFRKDLPENEGMLFLYPHPQILRFWMSNTLIALDIAYINHDKIIISIQHMEPLNEKKRYVSPVPAQYALEMNKGWFERNNVSVGDKVDFNL